MATRQDVSTMYMDAAWAAVPEDLILGNRSSVAEFSISSMAVKMNSSTRLPLVC